MTRSKRSLEGNILIDHRESPGISDQLMPDGMPIRSGEKLFEAPTFTCGHCPAIVIINPLRNRERAYCRGCDHYICDRCGGILAATRTCKPYKQLLDELQEEGLKTERGIICHG